MEKFTWKCVKPLFLKHFSFFIQLYIANVPIGSGSGYGSGSGENFPDPDPTRKVRIRPDSDPDPQPWIWAHYTVLHCTFTVLQCRYQYVARRLQKDRWLEHHYYLQSSACTQGTGTGTYLHACPMCLLFASYIKDKDMVFWTYSFASVS